MKEAKVEYPKIEYDEAMVAYKKLHPKIQEAVSKTDFFIGYNAAMESYRTQSTAVWQLCPKCNGDGHLGRYNSPALSSTTMPVCDVCNGSKVIASPTQSTEVKTQGADIIDWTIVQPNGNIDSPDELEEIIDKVGTQLRLHTVSGKGELKTVCDIVYNCQKFFAEKYAHPQVESAGVWVKASERIPKDDSPNYHVRLNGVKVNGNFYDRNGEGEIGFGVSGGGLFEDYLILPKDFDRIEWLDESKI